MAWISGMSGSVIVGATTLAATNWMVDWRADTIDVSNFKGNGWGAFLDGVPDYDVRVDCIYDTSDDPFGTLSIIPGNSIAMTLFMDTTNAGAKYTLGEVVVIDVTMEEGVRDTVRYSIVGKASAYYSTVVISYPNV